MEMTISQKIKTLMRNVIDMQQKELAAELHKSPSKMTRLLSETYNWDQDEGKQYLEEISAVFNAKMQSDVSGNQLRNLSYSELTELFRKDQSKKIIAILPRSTFSSKWMLGGLISLLGIGLYFFWPDSTPSTKIFKEGLTVPDHGDTISSTVKCQGYLMPLRQNHHAWLVTEVPDPDNVVQYWAKKPSNPIIPDENGIWETTIFEDGREPKINLALYIVHDSIDKEIKSWLRFCDSTGLYPSLDLLRGKHRIDRKNKLILLENVQN